MIRLFTIYGPLVYVLTFVCCLYCMYVSMYACTYVCMYYVNMRLYVCMYVCIYAWVCTFFHLDNCNTYKTVKSNLRTHIHTCMNICIQNLRKISFCERQHCQDMRRSQSDASIVVIFTMRRIVGNDSREEVLGALIEQKSCIVICYCSHKTKNCTFINGGYIAFAVHRNMSQQLSAVL